MVTDYQLDILADLFDREFPQMEERVSGMYDILNRIDPQPTDNLLTQALDELWSDRIRDYRNTLPSFTLATGLTEEQIASLFRIWALSVGDEPRLAMAEFCDEQGWA